MGKPPELILNSVFLKNRLAELGIKQWWLAEQVGVDRKTVVRWVQGKVRSLQRANAEALCTILQCSLEELTLADEADQLASAEDQRRAAQLLAESSLIDKLGPIGEWNVVEALLKATIVPNLPTHVLAELYNQLTVASWRQSKFDQAEIYNRRAEELARISGDNSALAAALLSKGNLFSWRGKSRSSIEAYREALALEKFLEPGAMGATLSNFGAVLYEAGDLNAGEAMLREAFRHFEGGGKPMNVSILWAHLAILNLSKGDVPAAETAVEASLRFAREADYRRGLAMGELLRAEVRARRGEVAGADEALRAGLAAFAALGIEEGLNYEFAGRVCRLLGRGEESLFYLEKGLEISTALPVYHAALLFEAARTCADLGRTEDARGHAGRCERLYFDCEAPLKAARARSLLDSLG